MGLSYKELRIKKLKSRWGSCDSLRRITLNRELIKIEKELIDYVVVHELAHLVHMNHSKEFHALVAHYLPQAHPLRKRLKAISLHNLSFDD
jgi:predicted metal-dependent hydrolase